METLGRLAFVALTVLALALALMQSSSGEATLRYMRWGTPGELAAQRELLREFEAAHPGVRVRVEVASWAEYWTKLYGSLAANDAPDVFLMGGDRLHEFLLDGVLTDLAPLVASSELDLGLYYENPVQIFQREGGLWGLPRDCNTVAVIYNRTMFEREGVPLPAGDWTWDGFLAAAQRLTRDIDGDGRTDQWGYLTFYNSQETRFAAWAWNAGAEFLGAGGRLATVDTPEMVRGLSFLTDLISVHRVAPDMGGDAQLDAQLFLSGRLAMITEGSWRLREFRTISQFEWDVAPMPRGPVRQVTSVNGLANVIWSGSDNPALAWELVRFLSSEPCQVALARGGTSIPALRSVAESEAFLDPSRPPANVRVFIDAIPTAHALDYTPGFHAWDVALQAALERAWRGQTSVADALAAAQPAIQRILDEAWAEWDAR